MRSSLRTLSLIVAIAVAMGGTASVAEAAGAEWHAEDGSAPATTCFSHRMQNGVILQKREPRLSAIVSRLDKAE